MRTAFQQHPATPFRRPVRLPMSGLGRCGQMTVEMAVVIPVALAIVYIMVNVMMYLNACARFDPLAAEAVRTQAASPGADSYDIGLRASRVQSVLAHNLSGYDQVVVRVQAQEMSVGGIAEGIDSEVGSALAFSLLPRQERYTCTLLYRPWGFANGIFGVQLFEVSHTVEFVIDPYKPGVLF